MKKSIYALCLAILVSVLAPGIAAACSGTYYYCNSCVGTPTKESMLHDAAENCLAGTSFKLINIETGEESTVWVVG